MLTNDILVSDLHLTSNTRDDYRWGIFHWLVKQCKDLGVQTVWILGDLTDSKDYHSSELVNKVVDNLNLLVDASAGLVHRHVKILRGNHDGVDPDCPYFRFLSHMSGIDFITQPRIENSVLLLPHSRNPEQDWAGSLHVKHYDQILMHATMDGSVAENGMALRGVPPSLFKGINAEIFAGDVHVPQTIGKVEYVGSPYPIHFGDKFKGRVVLLQGKTKKNLYYPSLTRHMLKVSSAKELFEHDLRIGDQVKIKVTLTQEQIMDWEKERKKIMAICEERQVSLYGLEVQVQVNPTKADIPSTSRSALPTQEVFAQFCKKENLPQELVKLGSEIMDGVK